MIRERRSPVIDLIEVTKLAAAALIQHHNTYPA